MELELESLRKELVDELLEYLRNGSADCDLFGGVKQSFCAEAISPMLSRLLVGEGTTDVEVGLSGETWLVSVTIELIAVPQQGQALRIPAEYSRPGPQNMKIQVLSPNPAIPSQE